MAQDTPQQSPPDQKVHWRHVKYGDPVKDDFRVFLTLMWRKLKLPKPTPLQLDIAYDLQQHGWSGSIDRRIIMAFRGAAKSWITAAYVLFNLHRDQQLKIGVLSGSGKRSVMFVNFALTMIREWDLINYLHPTVHQKQSSTGFDVAGALPDQTPSVWSAGVTSQIVGYRADIIIGDDVETNTNSQTEDMRDKLEHGVKEFDSIIKPGGQIIFLGTPQTEGSIYNKLQANGYVIRIWPVRYPNAKQRAAYGDKLAPYILWQINQNPTLVGKSTEPSRFTDEDLLGRELSLTKAVFALQFMLDTSLADADKFPLRLRDLITYSLDHKRGPDLVTWGNADNLLLKTLNAISLDGDKAYGPSSVAQTFSKWQIVGAFLDPSGRGADEMTLTIGSVLHSTAFVLKQAGWQDGHSEANYTAIAKLCVQYKVQKLVIEADFGGESLAQLLRPIIRAEWEEYNKRVSQHEQGATEVIAEMSKKVQKELRILEVLEPLFQTHRIVMNQEVLMEDWEQVQRRDGERTMATNYSLMYQITRLTREKGCLAHDDRVEGLGGLMRMFTEHLGLKPQEQAQEAVDERLLKELGLLEDEQERIQGGSVARSDMKAGLRSGRDRS